MTLDSVKIDAKYLRDSIALTITVRRLAPETVLLARSVLRAIAAFRSVRSLSLLVPDASSTVTLGRTAEGVVTTVPQRIFLGADRIPIR